MAAKPQRWDLIARIAVTLVGAAFFVLWLLHTSEPLPRHIPYSELVAHVEADRVKDVVFRSDEILGNLREGGPEARVVAVRIPRMDERPLLAAMEQHGVVVTGYQEESTWSSILAALAPLVVLLGVWALFAWVRRGTGPGRPMSFAQSKAKLYDRGPEAGVTFADVAGVDEARAELAEVVRFLKEPARFRAMGAHIPKGVLLVGAPGTGKTLLAKAVAGESGVPFFSMSGSEFVEMFVGVGASRVRDLFVQAKGRAPCIIFIDELDAVGKARSGARGFAANEEREQTLNQLLVEMDGFDSGAGLIIMAATNRPEILDKALLRAGRFDRQVLVDRPDVRGREAILRVHVKRVRLAEDLDLQLIARRTPGMVGADLANVVNEAALASVRRGGERVEARDFDEAIDRMQLGLKKEGRVMSDDEKRRVAVHEAGHALVALSVEHADPVVRVTIIPRSIGALGATLQLPTQERYLMTRAELRDRICVLLAGRAAEAVACSDLSTGAEDDLEKATELARQMVCRFGMSDDIGPLSAGARLTWPVESEGRRLSERTLRRIDTGVLRILNDEQLRARAKLLERLPALEAISRALLVQETIAGSELERLAGTPMHATAVASPPAEVAAVAPKAAAVAASQRSMSSGRRKDDGGEPRRAIASDRQW